MIERETIVVGGGPAGSAAAWRLANRGRECLVLDRESFPREKLCAGWITPEVLEDLEFTSADYPHRFLTFEKLNISLWRLSSRLQSVQHSIRRYEFDAWLLERSRAEIARHNVHRIVRQGDTYVIDEKYACRYLIGAGGTRCPVFRSVFRDHSPRTKALQLVALELEYTYRWQDPDCHLWFFTERLPGYSWYVPKADGYLNIGVGGLADRLKHNDDHIQRHWQALVDRLLAHRLIDQPPGDPHGYSYYLRDNDATTGIDNAFIVGDALGLATRDLCEGIGPAVQSGIAAANAIGSTASFETESISPFTSRHRLINRALERVYLHKSGTDRIRRRAATGPETRVSRAASL
jgi:flavin-dependent dehydrogenase